ncbi:Serine/threonine protein kinase [Parasponia andersonii]|uniref:non-specific serine/threonine protein kinase n=1 Tax=Parasponia andersonii TaxID=3476 RepID=A0A2P5D8L0_PARAD|nr:Serine/threonine protein kinase [Parasponia andersonii]
MGSKSGGNGVDLWSEIVASDQQQPQAQVFYRRRKPSTTPPDALPPKQSGSEGDGIRLRLSLAAPAPTKRISWNRSLSTRGRTSIAVGTCINPQPQVKPAKKRGKPPRPKGKVVQPPNFEKELAYFEEVDAFELLEESPSPKKFGTWARANQTDVVAMTHLSTRLNNWLISKKINYSCGPSSTLSKILGTPSITQEPKCYDDFDSLSMRTPEKSSVKISSHLPYVKITSKSHKMEDVGKESSEDLEVAIKKLSLASTSSSDADHFNPFTTLLAVCEQSVPSKFQDVFSKYCDLQNILKIGEGTFGEAFMAGNYVCKIVPIDGDFRVNGEVQKRSEELLEEVVLSRTLNCLRQCQEGVDNACSTFIGTIDIMVCEGSYDAFMIKAWEDWDEKHGSENDHPKEFPDKQRYVMFVLEHGGKDLESFVLLNFNEAQTFLVQVTAALAVAEAAYEFEHRDLHWGNVLLSRNGSATLQFTLEGKKMFVRTFGLLVSIIDFTLSRINTGEDILFLDLSSDPYLFKGPKGDKQSETYRKMKEVTEDCWEESFPRTNVLWLQYLVDILLLKKSFERTSKNERDLRSLKKRLDKYQSAKEAIFDPFFSDLLVILVE